MMRLLSCLFASAALFVATSCNAAELRGSSSTSSSSSNMSTIGLYMNGGDLITGLLVAGTLSKIMMTPCGDKFEWEVTHYGMTEETADGKFICEKALGGEANCEYLEAINCLAELIPSNATSIEASTALILWDLLGRTWPHMKLMLEDDTVKTIQNCMDTKGKTLLHEAGVKTKQNVKFDFEKTLDLAVTFNGKQEMNFWKEGINETICKWSNNADECCYLPPIGPPGNLMTTSSKANVDYNHPALQIVNQWIQQTAAEQNVLVAEQQ